MVNTESFVIPDEAIPYIGLQWPGAAKHAEFRNPETQFDAMAKASPQQKSKIVNFYTEKLQKDWETIVHYLPSKVRTIMDIGCGTAGIDVALAKHFIEKEVSPRFILLDKSEVSENLTYGFKGRKRFYASLDIAKLFLTSNGVEPEKVYTCEVGSLLPYRSDVDLLISLHSWGFHYPVDTYLEFARAILSNGGIGVTDVRNEKESIDSFRGAFHHVRVLQNTGQRSRVLFRYPR